MSLRIIFSFIIFVVLAVYFTFLNPGNLEIRLTQNLAPVQMPVVVFLLICILIGVVLASVLVGFTQMKHSLTGFMHSRSVASHARREKQNEKLFQKAENALEGGHRDKGLSLLQKILNQDPDHLPSLILLGNQHREAGRLQEALDNHRKAVDHDPENAKALQCLAEDFAAAGQSDKALEALKKARAQEPKSLAILRKLRKAYQDQGAWTQVMQTQKSILSNAQDPDDRQREKLRSSQLAYFYGCELIKQKQIEPAISELRRAIKENSKSLPPYVLLGDLYQGDGNTRAAIKTWKSGFQNTGSHICLLRLRSLYEQSKKPDEVIKLYQEAINKSHNSQKETLSLALAEIYLDQGKGVEAKQTLWDISTPSIPAHLLLIKAHQVKNESEQANRVIRAALKKVTDLGSQFVCQECHQEFERWEGVCPNCQGWDSFDTVLHHTL